LNEIDNPAREENNIGGFGNTTGDNDATILLNNSLYS
jgi:hypothetical protein